MTPRTKVALTIWGAGFLGVLSILCIDFAGLVALLPTDKAPPGFAVTPAIKLLALVQPTVLLTIAVLVGQFLSPSVRLGAPLLDAVAHRAPLPPIGPHLVAGIVGAIAGAALILGTATLCAPHFAPGVAARIATFQATLPLAMRLLYGGITEEVLLRWGFMTFLTWATWRIFQRQHAVPGPACYAAAILLSSFAFAVGHLPVAYLVVPQPNAAVVLFAIGANSAFGLVAGFLYWRRGLESAVIGHAGMHLLLAAAAHAGWYW